MTSASNINSNLMDEFEEAFQNCLLSLTKLEANTGSTKEEIEFEAQKTIDRFIDVARQMEAFFLQKRFLVSTLKPDQLIKDENHDLRIEIQRKEALLNKHYSRLEEWKACLSDIQQNPTTLNRPVGPAVGAVIPGVMSDGMPGTSMGVGAAASLGVIPQRSGMLPNMVGQMPQMASQTSQQHLQNHKILQAQQMQQQLRMMGKLTK
uniref:Mediator of RNA polymerase II transcription subunit 28 n=1 Tax=Glossina brevipalpis TaxID=37001 RepID=A0A1A9X1J3_9MUSC